jgi:GT2 family glycosyltransferase
MIPLLVVPTYTRHDLLVRMLESVDALVGHLVVIDNSGLGVELPDGPWRDVTLLPMPANLGVAASWNLAIKMGHRAPWIMLCSDDVVWPAGALDAFAGLSGEDRLVLSETWPHWCAFTIGMAVVRDVGLFDEAYYPAYFEDLDYERRMARAGVESTLGPALLHDNSSTLMTPGRDFAARRGPSHKQNQAVFRADRVHGFDPFRWRAQAWT